MPSLASLICCASDELLDLTFASTPVSFSRTCRLISSAMNMTSKPP
jgi:hypothetical protein